MLQSQIGQYRILGRIGTGGMGHVFVGEHALLGRRAAIKTLRPALSVNHEIVERFFNEARATSAISDPGVIQIFDFGYHVDGTAYIVMELLDGETLSTRIARRGRLALSDALRIARQIAGSLAAAHAHDIIHRDLKPENVFLVRDAETQGGERTKILDFGICKVGTNATSLTQSGAVIGTPVYMSPEQCRGAGEVDHRSDIYAFGCLVFHMITGRPPFLGDAPGDLIVAHLREDAPRASRYVSGLPPEIDTMLMTCLAKSPSDRFTSMVELQDVIGLLCAQLDGPWPEGATTMPTLPVYTPAGSANVAPRNGGTVPHRMVHPASPRARSTQPALPPPMLARVSPRPFALPVPEVRCDPFTTPPPAVAPSPAMTAAPIAPLTLEASAGFRAVEFEEATTKWPHPSPVPVPAPVPVAAATTTLGIRRRRRRSRRVTMPALLMFGCFVGVLTTSLDDGGAVEVTPAIAMEPPAASAPVTAAAAAAGAAPVPAAVTAPSATPELSPAEAAPLVPDERPTPREASVDSTCDFTGVANRTIEAAVAPGAAASPPAAGRDLPHSGKKVMKPPRQRSQAPTPRPPQR